jgi:hypothetical protein
MNYHQNARLVALGLSRVTVYRILHRATMNRLR